MNFIYIYLILLLRYVIASNKQIFINLWKFESTPWFIYLCQIRKHGQSKTQIKVNMKQWT